MFIRAATDLDREDIRRIHLSAFPEGEGAVVSTLAVDLLSEESVPETFALVAEAEGAVVGHVAFSPVTLDDDESFRGYILAPLAVNPDCQKSGVGTQLVKSGMQRLSDAGAEILFVYGDPAYYGRFGFSEDAAVRYSPAYQLQYPFGWQGVFLHEPAAERAPATITCVTCLNDPALW